MGNTRYEKRNLNGDMGRGYVHHFLYLEYFIGAAVEKLSGTFLVIISKVAMSFIHSIPPQTPKSPDVGGKDPISLKNLQKGDTHWDSEKEILGFIVYGEAKKVCISDDRSKNIVAKIRNILKKNVCN